MLRSHGESIPCGHAQSHGQTLALSWGLYSFWLLLWLFLGSSKPHAVHLTGRGPGLISVGQRYCASMAWSTLGENWQEKIYSPVCSPWAQKGILSLGNTSFQSGYVPLPQLVHAVGRNIMLILTSLRNGKRLLWVLSSHWEEGSIYCTLNVSRDMVTKCPQNRQSPQKGTSVRDMGLKTPKCIIMNGALKCNPHFRSLSLRLEEILVFLATLGPDCAPLWCLDVCFSWSPTVHVCGLQRKASENCAFFSHMGC